MVSLKKRAKLTTVNSDARWWRLSSRCGATRGKEKVVVRVRGGADRQMRARFYVELKSRENGDARKAPSHNCDNCERRGRDNRVRTVALQQQRANPAALSTRVRRLRRLEVTAKRDMARMGFRR